MSAMEESLRRALGAGDASDLAFRESIYAASERALERMLSARPTDEAAAAAQRTRLAETINRVEHDYFTVYQGGAEEDPGSPEEALRDGWTDAETIDETQAASEREALPDGADGPRFDDPADLLEHEDAGDPARPMEERPTDAEGLSSDGAEGPAEGDDGSDARGTPPVPPVPKQARAGGLGRRWAEVEPSGRGSRRAVLGLILLAALIIVGYLFYAAIFRSGAGTGPAATAEQTVTAGAPDDTGTWIEIFTGSQLEAISTPSGGRVEAVAGAGSRPAVRLASAGEGGEILVGIGPGVVGEISGRKVRVEITVGSPDGTPREFGVRCLFGEESFCGRQRFTTTQESEIFVLDMTVPSRPPDRGDIALDPGVAGAAKGLDLYSVRLRADATS